MPVPQSRAAAPSKWTFFQHVPIKPEGQIRVVDILPGLFGDDVQCRVSAHNLDADKDHGYDALSYVWGKPEDQKKSIYWNNIPNFEITMNLYKALRRLRRPHKTRRMWIDQLCINQDCDNDKKPQVRQMASIFRQARRVYVWFGETSENVHTTFDVDEVNWKVASKALDHAVSKGEFDPWWTRAWIIQEFALAKEPPIAMFGPYEQTWGDLICLVDEFVELEFSLLFRQRWAVLRIRLRRYDSLRRSEGATDLHFLSTVLREARTRNPEDKVYCILSSLPEGEQGIINLNHNKSAAAVFAQATYASMLSTGSLGILSLVPRLSHTKSTGFGAPSWAADFTYAEDFSLQLHVSRQAGLRKRFLNFLTETFQHAGVEWGLYWLFDFSRCETMSWCERHPQEEAQISIDPNDARKLTLTGLIFDSVQDLVSVDVELPRNPLSLLRRFIQIILTLISVSTSLPMEMRKSWGFNEDEKYIVLSFQTRLARGSPYHQLMATDTTNAIPHLQHDRTIRMIMAFTIFRMWDKTARPGHAPKAFTPSAKMVAATVIPGRLSERSRRLRIENDLLHEMELEDKRTALFLLFMCCDSRWVRFFITAAGFIGLGPEDLQSNDVITLCYGSRYPIALRPMENGNWQFVGFCYVRGIMDHELLVCFPEIDLKEVKFVLE